VWDIVEDQVLVADVDGPSTPFTQFIAAHQMCAELSFLETVRVWPNQWLDWRD
jgi:hypothetical protein